MFNNVALPLIIIWLLTVLRYNLIICIDYTMVFIISNLYYKYNYISIFCKRDDQYLLNKYYDQMIGWSIFILLVLWSADVYDY